MLARQEMKSALEAILFARSEAITPEEMARALEGERSDVEELLQELMLEYNADARGVQIIENAGGYVLCTRPEYHEIIRRANRPTAVRLSQAALETLAIIAYRQPVTRAEIESHRGVKTDRVLHTLLGRGLIEEVGRKDGPGRPSMFATTSEFLKLFGLTHLAELPREPKEESLA
ncbi:MAG: SMC-Scp complex subunit ScpB [Solirubrobacterales bacterium]